MAKQQVADGGNEPDLAGLIERIMDRLEERDTVNEDIKEIYAEAKGMGFDTAIMRKVVARQRRDRKEVEEEDAMIETYESALAKKLRKAGVAV